GEGRPHRESAVNQCGGPAAIIAGDAADQDAEGEADDNAKEADRQRDPCAVNDARQEIAAKPVGAEQEQLPAFRRADQVQIAIEETPEAVAVAMTEELDRLMLRRIGRVDPAQIG